MVQSLDHSQGRSQGRAGSSAASTAPATFTGNRALQIEEPLIFELGQPGRCGVDLPEPPKVKDRLNGLRRTGEIGLPGLSEPQVVQHYTRLSQKNYAIDMGIYPLGSCTMKHNPRINEKVARLAGIGDLHPLQPVSTVQGALELIDSLAHWLKSTVFRAPRTKDVRSAVIVLTGGGLLVELIENERSMSFSRVAPNIKDRDRKSTRLNSSHTQKSRMPSSA